ncbi:MAG: A/G-specific adenine glycosylase [Sphingobacteriales bacterium]|nr:A/G-specific adenine glycosylase [Sphingobacteriales bacterium]MBI3720578.1 A/G-specific adenine glycosylase [Sphingobacteriales bacterium]
MNTFISKELYKSSQKAYFTSHLLKWNEQVNKRQMPWKGEKDPYKIWLSEIILQQTRVEQGWSYYEKFIKAFPNIQKLAKAEDEKVFKLWEGLGYYTRCKNLLATARKISAEYKGKFPEKYKEIVSLKGVGPYTAAAIASFAYNLPHAVVDGNVMRVLSRYYGIETPIDSTQGKKLFQQIASDGLPENKAGVYNQAIMDFGATVCKPQNPTCKECPMKKKCVAFIDEKVNVLPVKEKSIKKKERWFYFLVIQSGGKTYVRKRKGKDVWENLYEYVALEIPSEMDAATFIKSTVFKKSIGAGKFEVKNISKVYRQLLSHQTIYGRFITLNISKPLKHFTGYILADKKEIKQLPFPRLINNWHEDGHKNNILF